MAASLLDVLKKASTDAAVQHAKEAEAARIAAEEQRAKAAALRAAAMLFVDVLKECQKGLPGSAVEPVEMQANLKVKNESAEMRTIAWFFFEDPYEANSPFVQERFIAVGVHERIPRVYFVGGTNTVRGRQTQRKIERPEFTILGHCLVNEANAEKARDTIHDMMKRLLPRLPWGDAS